MLPVPRLYGGPKPGPSFVCAQDRESVGRVVGWLVGRADCLWRKEWKTKRGLLGIERARKRERARRFLELIRIKGCGAHLGK